MSKFQEKISKKLFKVVKITDLDGIEKHHYPTQSLVYEKVVKVISLEKGSSAILIPNEHSRVLHTSTIQNVTYSETMELPARLIIGTLNTVYILDEVEPERPKKNIGVISSGVLQATKLLLDEVRGEQK